MRSRKLMTAVIFGGAVGLITSPALSQRQPAPEATRPGAAAPGAAHWGHAGMTQEEIQQVHHALQARGYQPGDTLSLTDPKTQEAIRSFQRDQNIPVTGTLDQRTAALLGVGPFAAAPTDADVGHGPPEMAPAGEATVPPDAGFWGHLGMTEQEIQQVHQALRAKGYQPGEMPTVTDRQTREAILAFQRDHRLPMTGTLDERTAALLGVQIHQPGVAPHARVEPRPGEPAALAIPEARVEPRPGEPLHFTREDIEHVQDVLRARGYKPGTELSLTDRQMMEAIRSFQRDNNLPVTGRIDDKTAALMGIGPYAVAGAPDRPEKLRPGGDDPPPGTEWGHLGMTEQEIQQVQQALQAKGYQPGEAATVTDPKTREAIREFQRDHKLPVTGTLDERTAALLGVPYDAPATMPRTR